MEYREFEHFNKMAMESLTGKIASDQRHEEHMEQTVSTAMLNNNKETIVPETEMRK